MQFKIPDFSTVISITTVCFNTHSLKIWALFSDKPYLATKQCFHRKSAGMHYKNLR